MKDRNGVSQGDIRQFLVDTFLFGDGGDLKDSDSLISSGILDSTGVLELVTFLEERFQISLAPEEIVPSNLDRIESITNFVDSKVGVRSGREIHGTRE